MEMRHLCVLMIDAGPVPASSTAVALEEIQRQLQLEGIKCDLVYIGDKPVQSCLFCGHCKDTGRCVLDDCLNPILERGARADGYIFASQSHYGAASGSLASLIHRFVTADRTCTGKPVAAVVTCRRSGATSALSELNSFFAMKSMPIVTSSYWNLLVGSTPELVRQDLEGLRTMRNLARNFAWLLKSLDAGRQQGIPAPILE